MEPLWLFSQVPTKTPSDKREAQGQGKQRKSSTTLNDVRERFVFLCLSCALRNKTIPYFSLSFDNPNGRQLTRKIVEIQKSCYHGNLTSHFSSLFMPCSHCDPCNFLL